MKAIFAFAYTLSLFVVLTLRPRTKLYRPRRIVTVYALQNFRH